MTVSLRAGDGTAACSCPAASRSLLVRARRARRAGDVLLDTEERRPMVGRMLLFRRRHRVPKV
ncbi:hypothetical protein ACNKHN_03460 [Shigella flexneri]